MGQRARLEAAGAGHQGRMAARTGGARCAHGTITPEAARATGIPEGLPLLAAAADKACEVIGPVACARTWAA